MDGLGEPFLCILLHIAESVTTANLSCQEGLRSNSRLGSDSTRLLLVRGLILSSLSKLVAVDAQLQQTGMMFRDNLGGEVPLLLGAC